MGFWSGLAKTVTGAATGFLTSGGNPLGAVVGGISGLASSGGGGSGGGTSKTAGTSATSGSTSQTQTQQTQLRDLTDQEKQLYSLSQRGLADASAAMTPEQRAAEQAGIYQDIYGGMQRNITQGYDSLGARQYASAARRGVAGSSRGADDELLNRSAMGRDLGAAGAQASLQARQAVLMEEENRRANAAALRTNINDLWAQRLYGSKVVRTSEGTTRGTGSTSGSSTAPDTFWGDAAAGLGGAVASGQAGKALGKVNDLFGGI